MKKWIEEKLKQSRQLVIDYPGVIISQFNEENERKREYNGRQVLEMLQNAEDEVQDDGLVIIKLYEDRLVIANKGNPFSKDGVESLMTPNLSSKQPDDTKIGSKGLGFRSLLNWSESIEIVSKDLSIEFSKDVASLFLQAIYDDHPHLQEYFKSKREEQFPIPILLAPRWKDVPLERFKDFGAVITVRFNSSKVYNDIKSQLDLIDAGALIFLRKLTKIQIFVYESPNNFFVREILKTNDVNLSDGKVRIIIKENNSEVLNKTWSILSRTGEIQKEFQEQGFHKFELKVALSDDSEDNVNRLFSFFKTDVYFGFSGLVHGTFQLTGDRNHLVKGPINTFLLKELCHLLIESAVRLSKLGVNWLPLKLLSFDSETEKTLKDFDFYKNLVGQIAEYKLFPTVHDEYIDYAGQPVFYEENFADVIPFKKYDILRHLLKHSEDINLVRLLKVVGQKGMYIYNNESLRDALNSISEKLTIDERTNLVLFVAKSKVFDPKLMPQLLLDESSKLIDKSFDVFTKSEDSSFVIPAEVEICFLNSDLLLKLKEQGNLKSNHDVVEYLARFNIHEYSLSTLLRKAFAREKAKRKLTSDLDLLVKLISSLFEFWKKNAKPPSISDIDIELPSRDAMVRSARSLHFGSNVKSSINSQLNEEILLSENSLFLCDLKLLQLQDTEEAVSFLHWIGVKEEIEIKKLSINEIPKSYLSKVVDHLDYPFTTTVNRTEINSSSNFFNRTSKLSLETQSIVGIEKAITLVRPEVLICWLAFQKEVLKIVEGQVVQKLHFKIDRFYHEETLGPDLLPQYLGHLLSDIEWLPTILGNLEKPGNCVLTEFKLLGSTVPTPAIDENDEIFKEYDISPADVREVLHRIGVKKDFSHLTQSSLYDLLFKLPETDQLGQTARFVYTAIFKFLGKSDFNKMDSGYRNFIESGKVLVKSNDQLQYVPIKDAYYLEDHSLSQTIIRQINVFEIETGIDSALIKDIFGVKSISDIKYKVVSEEMHFHPLNEQFKLDLNSFRIAFYCDYITTDPSKEKLAALKSLNVNLYSSFSAEFTIKDQGWQPLDISDLEYFNIEHDGSTETFVYVPNREYESFDSLKDEIKFCESVVSIVCNCIDIINDSKYNYLFSRSENGRIELTSNKNGGDKTFYTRSEAAFSSNEENDLIEKFWRPVMDLCGKPNEEQLNKEKLIESFGDLVSKKDLVEIINGISYSVINSPKNLGLIRKLFSLLGIDLKAYTRKATLRLNFQSTLQEEINSEHYKLTDKFSSWLYYALISKSALEKQEYFDKLHQFNKIPEIEFTIESLDPIFYYDQWLSSNWGLSHAVLTKQEQMININEIIIGNSEKLKGQLEPELLPRFDSNNYGHKSLLLFGEIEALTLQLKKLGTKETEGSELAVMVAAYSSKNAGNFTWTSESNPDTNRNNINPKNNAVKPGGYKRPYVPIKKLNEIKAKTGLKGERLVYDRLLVKSNVNDLKWLSENAREAGFSTTGDDSLGYDMRYTDENGHTVYIEVKSSIYSELEFTMSVTEYDFALKNMSNYVIVLVSDIESENCSYHVLKLSDIPEGLKSGHDFSVQTESYHVRVLANARIKPFELSILPDLMHENNTIS